MSPGPAAGGAPPVLLPYQQAWVADRSDWKVCEKGRRTGLTWAEAADAALVAGTARNAGGCDHVYIGTERKMAREFIDAVGMWARAFDKAASAVREVMLRDGDRDILTFRVDFASGFEVLALSSNPRSLRGRQANVTCDEAAFCNDLPELLKAAAAMTMWGSKVRVISTHNGEENPFNELVTAIRAGRKSYGLHRVTLDGAVADGLYRRICEVRKREWSPEAERAWRDGLMADAPTREDALEEYQCVPKRGGGAYMPLSLIESCMADAPVLRFEGSDRFNSLPDRFRKRETREWLKRELDPLLARLDPKRLHVLGEDFGRTADLTVLAPMEIGATMRRTCPFLVELHNVPFRVQKQILYHLCDRLPRFVAAKLDARGNGQYLAEVAFERYGDRVEAVMPTQAWYLENFPPLKAAFEDGSISIPRNDDVASDLRAVQVVKGIPKVPDVRTGADGDRHGDAAIALVMAHAASRSEYREYGWTPVPRDGRGPARDPWDADAHEEDIGRPIRCTSGFARMRGNLL